MTPARRDEQLVRRHLETLDGALATHFAASAGHSPTDYASAIDSLVPMKILDPDFSARFRAVAGFRNLLVHGYLEVDLSRYDIMVVVVPV
jgi:uncharacterized protein YutE (UPF0331/DUF86 family)